MQAFLNDANSVLTELGSDIDVGLDSKGIEKSRQKYGVNVLTKKKPESLFRRILSSTLEPMIIMLIVAGLIALVVNIIRYVSGEESDFWECIGVFAAIALSVAITVIMEGRSAKAFEALSKIGENTMIKVIRNGNATLINQQQLVVGDIILLSSGDKIPADARLLQSTDLAVDESALTGESVPAKKDYSASFTDFNTPLAERKNMIYSGNYITSGFCTAIITEVGDSTEFGKIAKHLSDSKKGKTPLQEKLARLGKLITIFGVIAASIVFISQLISFALNGGLNFSEVSEAFVTSIVLIVAAVPEGLPTIVAVSLSISVIKLSKQNALVKKMIASETIGCINVICSDKTGTLTENKMTVNGFYDTKWHYNDVDIKENKYIMHNICLNTTADVSDKGEFIGNPTECAILNFYNKSCTLCNIDTNYKDERKDHVTLHTFPFSSELKHMTTVSDVHGEIVTYVKGSPELILSMCSMDNDDKLRIEKEIKSSQDKAMRVIAFAHKVVDNNLDYADEKVHDYMESQMTFDGFVAISDPLREDVYDAVKECKRAGIALKILTGDNKATAIAIAKELHLLDNKMIAVEAKDIADLSDEELSKQLDGIAVIARSTPTIKMRVVNILKYKGNIVAVTGDGINDAPALKNADVGVAMGISGTEVSKEASDIVLLDDSFSTIVKAVKWGRGIYENFKRFIQFQLTVNVSSVIVVLVSILIGLKAPFTALQLLWINIIMDGPPALTLGLEPNYQDLMSKEPTSRSANILNKSLLFRIMTTGIYVSILFLAQYIFNFLGATKQEETTVLFTFFALIQLFNAFNCRELYLTSIFKNLFKNKLMLVVVGFTFVLQIIFIQFAGSFFGTVSLGIIMWLKIIALSFSVIVVSEIVKLFLRIVKKNKERTIKI